ncbi:MAG: hypothetical protein MZV64_71605 [Ignavibacteriales bacterium]|nr:hypothetical protein [Ignavibacteriales bacterium]
MPDDFPYADLLSLLADMMATPRKGGSRVHNAPHHCNFLIVRPDGQTLARDLAAVPLPTVGDSWQPAQTTFIPGDAALDKLLAGCSAFSRSI